MNKTKTGQYDLEDRTFTFAKNGANYIEVNESLSKKDFLMRIRICRKEAKESRYWLRLIDVGDDSVVNLWGDSAEK